MTDAEEARDRRNRGARDNYQYWKSVARCAKCHTRDAYTLNGRAVCADCAEKAAEVQRKRRRAARARGEPASSTVYERKNRERGLCSCCSNPAIPGRSTCAAHAAKQRAYGRKYREKRRRGKGKKDSLYTGVCRRCENPCVKGYQYCADCLTRQRAYLSEARKIAREQNYKTHKAWAKITFRGGAGGASV